jgi:hypothetical protein
MSHISTAAVIIPKKAYILLIDQRPEEEEEPFLASSFEAPSSFQIENLLDGDFDSPPGTIDRVVAARRPPELASAVSNHAPAQVDSDDLGAPSDEDCSGDS